MSNVEFLPALATNRVALLATSVTARDTRSNGAWSVPSAAAVIFRVVPLVMLAVFSLSRAVRRVPIWENI